MRRRVRRTLASALLLVAAVACGAGGEGAAPSAGSTAAPGPPVTGGPGPPGPGDGFVVWESNRSGSWRLWRKDLAGGEPAPLTRGERGFEECCPQISPDGRRIAYLRFRAGGPSRYPGGGRVGELRLVGADGAGDRLLADSSRTYHENRAVVWLDDRALVRIGADHRTLRLDVESGKESPLVAEPGAPAGWLLDPTLHWAVDGLARFSPYDAARRRVAERPPAGGCQPVFSGDGRWGVWIAGAGGPIRRLDLATGATRDLVRKNDPRLPDGLGYLYFPMPSRDGRLLAFAASTGEHDHFAADYEVLVAETDPATLELVGPPARITRDPATDRYPDAWLAPLPLGLVRGEAPLVARFEAPEGGAAGEWRWDLSDGRTASGARLEATWGRPGRFEVVARGPLGELRGQVVVAPAAPPRPLEVALREGGALVAVTFDEPVAADAVRATLASGLAVAGVELADGDRTLLVRPAEPVRRFDRLTLVGVRDRAQRPNLLAPTTLEIEPPVWPASADGLLLAWRTAGAANTLADPAGGPDRAATLTPRGGAELDRDGAMVVGDGVFVADQASASAVVSGARDTNELSVELVVTGRDGDGVLLASGVAGQENFVLAVRQGRLVFAVRAKARGPGSLQEAVLAPLGAAGASRHVAVTFTPGHVVLYLDGETAAESGAITGDFFPWRERAFAVGGRPDGGEPWRGRLEGIALYNRVLSPGEVAEDALRYRRLLAERAAVDRVVVVAVRGARSRVPTLDEITPYRRALVVVEYRVESLVEGTAPERIRVARWAIQDGAGVPEARLPEGTRERLVLEPYTAQSQLEAVYLGDTLPRAPGVPLLFAVEATVFGGG